MTPLKSTNVRTLTGGGEIPGRSWWRGETEEIPYVAPPAPGSVPRLLPLGHPAAYEAGTDLIDAVNTALLLRKPLLVTGKPGTGKTELAERIAYEFDLGAVLRFEAQSLSEANDLFYRFHYIAQLVASVSNACGGSKCRRSQDGTAQAWTSACLPKASAMC